MSISIKIQNVRRLLPSGASDPSFGRTGSVNYVDPNVGSFSALTVDGTGTDLPRGPDRATRLQTAEQPAPPHPFLLERTQANGRLDNTFGHEGAVTAGFGGPADAFATQVELVAKGRILVGGGIESPELASGGGFALARFLPGSEANLTQASIRLARRSTCNRRSRSIRRAGFSSFEIGTSFRRTGCQCSFGSCRAAQSIESFGHSGGTPFAGGVIGGQTFTVDAKSRPILASTRANGQIGLMRLLANGRIDRSFGTRGSIKGGAASPAGRRREFPGARRARANLRGTVGSKLRR